ncbi:hypothetical protein DL771_003919 [Monosporascus sp. 5C6A]|nr:hypothetical protein DL771_003919 [Monosporascus sp. 5C6A]
MGHWQIFREMHRSQLAPVGFYKFWALPMEWTDSVRDVITTHWARGVQAERPYAGLYEFKLCGRPWAIRRLRGYHDAGGSSGGILDAPFNAGWVLSIDELLGGKQGMETLNRLHDLLGNKVQRAKGSKFEGCYEFKIIGYLSSPTVEKEMAAAKLGDS